MSKTASGLSRTQLRNRSLPALPSPGVAISADEVAQIEKRVATAVPFVESVDAAVSWLDGARALESYLRSRGLQRPMLGAQRRIEARIGELLGEPKPGTRTDLQPRPHEGKVDRHDAEDFRILRHAFDGVALGEDEWRKSRRALVALIRERAGLMPETPPLPEGQFSCIVADPPWTLDTGPDTWGGTGESGHDALAYPQMSLPEIEALGVEGSAGDDAHLYLWTTNRYLEASYSVARAWGFKPSVMLVWAKPIHGVGLGDSFRLTTEFVLFARRGHLDHLSVIPRTWFDWPRSRHSVKPAAFFEMVERVTPGPRLELFGRKERDGWEVWGDEVSAGK